MIKSDALFLFALLALKHIMAGLPAKINMDPGIRISDDETLHRPAAIFHSNNIFPE